MLGGLNPTELAPPHRTVTVLHRADPWVEMHEQILEIDIFCRHQRLQFRRFLSLLSKLLYGLFNFILLVSLREALHAHHWAGFGSRLIYIALLPGDGCVAFAAWLHLTVARL